MGFEIIGQKIPFMKITLLVVALFVSLASIAQNKKLDSLYRVLENHPQEDTTRVKLIIEIARREFFRNKDKALSLSKEALEIAQEKNSQKALYGYILF